VGIAFGTFLYYYMAFDPAMAHAVAFGASALVVALWLSPEPIGVRRACHLGLACGLVALTRWADVLICLLPACDWLPRLRVRAEWRRLPLEWATFALALVLAFSPQMIVWWRLYGSPLTVPQGRAFFSSSPAYDTVLFSPLHGLFSWSPLLYLALVGLGWFCARRPLQGLAALAFIAALTHTTASVIDVGGGSAFGARRFDATLPLFGLGLALAIEASERWIRRRPQTLAWLVVGALTLWNLVLGRQYQTGAWDYSEPVAFEEMGHGFVSWIDRTVGPPFSLPASLFGWLTTGRHPAEYDSLFTDRRFARWSVRMGWDDRIYLVGGFSAPQESAGVRFRIVQTNGDLLVPLHRPWPYTLGVRVRAQDETADLRLTAFVNLRHVGSVTVTDAWTDQTMAIPESCLRAGRNFIRLWPRRPVAITGVWLDPQ
jgi:hypothetical protein